MMPRAVATVIMMRRRKNTILAVAMTMGQLQHVSILRVQHNNQPTTGAAKAGGGGGSDGDSNGSGEDGDNGGSGSGEDNGGNSAAAAAVAAGATKTMAVTAMAGGTNNN
jgi:hypothetical protein